MNECVTCGYPTVRPEGHAEWCREIAALNAICTTVPSAHGTKTRGAQGCPCDRCQTALRAYLGAA